MYLIYLFPMFAGKSDVEILHIGIILQVPSINKY